VQAAAMLALRGACLLSSTEAELLGEIDVIPSWS
jgi:Holliday junction resolvase-like predicted endonuclease